MEQLSIPASALAPAVAPTFSGEGYVVIDVQELDHEALPSDNVVLLLVPADGMWDVQELVHTLDEESRGLRGSKREELRDVPYL